MLLTTIAGACCTGHVTVAIPESSEWTTPSDTGSVRLPFSST